MNDKRRNPRPEGKKSSPDRLVLSAVERMVNRIIEQEKQHGKT